MKHPFLLTLALGGALVAGLALGRRAPAQEAPAPAAPAVRWEYRSLPWTKADTLAALRSASGDEASGPNEMVRALAEKILPRDHPGLQQAVDLRLATKLQKAGLEGWEAFWVREQTTTVVDGFALPAPTVLLRRPKR